MSVKISDHFIGIAAKRLRHGEIHSRQHELNGFKAFKTILGTDKLYLKGKVIYFSDNEEEMIDNESNFTWYDGRINNPDRSPEYRLYFSDNDVIPNAEVGDLVILCKTVHDTILVIVAAKDSTSEKQLMYLFGIDAVGGNVVQRYFQDDNTDIGFAGKYILESIGIEIEIKDEVDYLKIMQNQFGMTFPTTAVFSQFARSTVSEISILDDPDHALISWWDREGELLRIFEKAVVGERIREGFGDDVDGFIQFALTVINRRKSRAGHSFENHLQTIFDGHKIQYSKGAKTERNNKPDFIFPSVDAYRDSTFPDASLHMLGVKTTAKDRWRQVLSEADRVSRKHLITLEPAISKSQTDEMEAQNLQLIIPFSLHQTYSIEQMTQIIDLKTFIDKLS